MAIPTRDLKILWAKSAGRCAITRAKLVETASDAVPSRNLLLGEVCHIVAESPDGPRGKSLLTLDERNRYPNLLLLCRAEHERIDQDPSAWPIERLHQIKADHELWVEEQLTEAKNHEDEFYANLVNLITERMGLEHWMGISDDAIRGLVRLRWISGTDEVCVAVVRAIWPGKHRVLERAIKNLARRTEDFTKFYLQHATPDSDADRYQEHKFYRDVPGGDGAQFAASKIFMLWQKICGLLLMNLTHALNEYADAVRAAIKPDYFFVSGKFVVLDGMGVTNQLEGVTYLPKSYQDLNPKLKRYYRWTKLLSEGRNETIVDESERAKKEASRRRSDERSK